MQVTNFILLRSLGASLRSFSKRTGSPAGARAAHALNGKLQSFAIIQLRKGGRLEIRRGRAVLKSAAQYLLSNDVESAEDVAWLALPTVGVPEDVDGTVSFQLGTQGPQASDFEHLLSDFDFLLGLSSAELQELDAEPDVARAVRTLRAIPGDWITGADPSDFEAHCARFHRTATLQLESAGCRLLPRMGPSMYTCVEGLRPGSAVHVHDGDVWFSRFDISIEDFVDVDEGAKASVRATAERGSVDVFVMTRLGVRVGTPAREQWWFDEEPASTL
jgi:hypothetical protein